MTVQHCDICGGNLSVNESIGFAICELCGAKKVLEVKPVETIRVSEDYVIPQKFSNISLEKEKKDLEKKINGILQENRNLDGLIEKAHKDINHWQDKVGDAQNEMNYINASSSGDAALWADDPYDPRYLELQQNQFRKMLAIKSDFDNAQKEITQAKNKISSLKSKILENNSEINSLQSELKSIDDKLRKTPSQRVEEHYQRLIEEKKTIFSQQNSFMSKIDLKEFGAETNIVMDKLTELVKQFGEMEGYKDTAALKKECFDLAVKMNYDYLVRLKNEADSNEMATPEVYTFLAKEFREVMGGYADTEILAKDCEKRAAEAQYNRLANAKNNATGEAEYMNLAKQFRAMNGYKNTAELANECDSQYRMLRECREEQERKENEERMRREEREKIKLAERKRLEEQEKREREEQERLKIQREEKQRHRFLIIAIVAGILFTAGFLIVGNREKEKTTKTITRSIQSSEQIQNASPAKTITQSIQPSEQIQNTSPAIPGRFPQASERLLTVSDLRYLSKKELGIMRNEIFARHGYIFQTPQWKAYFQNQNWYSPRSSDVNSLLTDIELKNIPLIKSYE